MDRCNLTPSTEPLTYQAKRDNIQENRKNTNDSIPSAQSYNLPPYFAVAGVPQDQGYRQKAFSENFKLGSPADRPPHPEAVTDL